MKSLTFRELDLMLEMAESFEGFYVSDAIFSDDVLVLFLKAGPKEAYLITDVGSAKPVFIATQESLPGLKKQTKPLLLFLRARLFGKKLISARRRKEYGRLVELHFEGGDESFDLELLLFPQDRNIIARNEGAQVSLNKVKELRRVGTVNTDEVPRSPSEVYSDWLGNRQAVKSTRAADPATAFEKLKAKKIQGLQALRDKHKQLKDDQLRKAGEWLSEHRSMDVPLELSRFVDPKKSLRVNIAEIFEKVKANKKKLEAVEERLRALENELAELSPDLALSTTQRKKPPESPLAEAKGRTKHFENGISAYIGKSAADNLKILRKAKAWYWWVHPKDLPGSHAIIAVDKGAQLDSTILRQVAMWTLEETLTPKQLKDWQGVKCQFIYTECRFVTPIKGDKLGRVHYKNEKMLTLTVQS